MICYAIKDSKSGLFYNRVHKDLRPLSQNTAFYKTVNGASSEINPRTCLNKIGFVQSKVLYAQLEKQKGKYARLSYSEIDKYREEHKDDILMKVVTVEINEVE